ncbi:cytochrome-c peroxidase [Thermogutta sp.]|uniref:cytochrome-c peroxidase n=1 Tax=Thermogutta sp. TaxID=1962930 RepID=UPI00321FF34E
MLEKTLIRWLVCLIAVAFLTGCPKPATERGQKPAAHTTGPAAGAAAPSTAEPAAPSTTEQAAQPGEAQPAAQSQQPASSEEAPKPEAQEAAPAPTQQEAMPAPETTPPAAESQPAQPVAPQESAEKPKEEASSTPAEKPAASPPAEAQSAAPQGTPYEVKVPLGLPPLPIPEDNPMTVEKIELGKMLYFDKRVSADGSVSCATCHDPNMAWAEHTPTSKGIHGQVGTRNAPTVINAAYATSQFWDGRAKTLEEQALGPVANPTEMGHTIEGMVQSLDGIPQYKELFQKVFGTGVTPENFAKAIAAFERTVLSGNSPYDRYRAGDQNALTEAQKRGLKVFEESGCADCHTPPLFSSYEFYNAGVGMNKEKPDEGRKAVTGKDEDFGKFRVPSLREVANTAPYFHDGSAATLEEAVAVMAAGGIDNPHRSQEFDTVREAKITPEQQKDLVEFLKALSGEYPKIEPPQLP